MKRRRRGHNDSFVWISYSDLMTTLTLAFILIMLGLIAVNRNQSKRMHKVIEDITEARQHLIAGLRNVTKLMIEKIEDCKDVEWEVKEDRNAIRVTFRSGREWFREGEDELESSGQKCLKYFSREWLRVLYSKEQYRDKIEQLVVEGHTNSNAVTSISKRNGKVRVEPFLGNLDLSQRRAFNAVEFILSNMSEDGYTTDDLVRKSWPNFLSWQRRMLTATGRSSSEPVPDPLTHKEDKKRSKRIEFKFIMKHEFAKYEEALTE